MPQRLNPREPRLEVGQPDVIGAAVSAVLDVMAAKVIAAINIDPDAPIFKHCSFGIVEDYRKVIPLLREQLVSRQQ